MICTGRFGYSDWALAVTLIAVDERSVPAMSVLRSKRTGRHRTATVTRSIILRPSLFRATFLWQSLLTESLGGHCFTRFLIVKLVVSNARQTFGDLPPRNCAAIDAASHAQQRQLNSAGRWSDADLPSGIGHGPWHSGHRVD